MKKEAALKVDNLLNGKKFLSPGDLAEAYLKRDIDCPIAFSSDAVRELKKMIENVPSERWRDPAEIKCVLDNLPQEFYERITNRIEKSTLKKLKDNYKPKTINGVIEALKDFDWFLNQSTVKVISDERKKKHEHARKDCKNRINVIKFLLTDKLLSEEEKETLHRLCQRYEMVLYLIELRKRVTVDPITEIQINKAATPALLLDPTEQDEWIKDFISACSNKVFLKPPTRPKKIVHKALAIVIFRLLEDTNTDKTLLCLKGRRQELTADLINQGLGLSKAEMFNSKKVENALHTT